MLVLPMIGLNTMTSDTFNNERNNKAAYAPAEVPVKITLLYFSIFVFLFSF